MSTSKLSNAKRLSLLAGAFALMAVGNLIAALGRTRDAVSNLQFGLAILLALSAVGVGVAAHRANNRSTLF
jgi:hypothetical protein